MLVYTTFPSSLHDIAHHSMRTVPMEHVGPVCVQFDYHMYGRDMGSLQLSTDVQDDYTYWATTGDHGDVWWYVEVTVNLRQESERVCI